jgi:Ca2+-binding EF-hand superfamily protein
MSISRIGSSSSGIPSWQTQRPDPAKMASDLFSKLNTDGSGGISASELESALSSASGASSTDASSAASSMIQGLDSDGDGQISQDELTSGFKQLAQRFDDHFNASRTSGMGQPPSLQQVFSGIDSDGSGGISQSELATALGQSQGTSSSSPTSSTSSTSYDPADTNQDGAVSDAERLVYEQKTADSGSDAAGAQASQNDMLKHMLMQLAHAYGGTQTTAQSGSALSVAA